ncbi:MAG: DNA-directed RNA polymerase subunit omega [Candidatus Aerophobetes bacterium]|nr:DNA-directed RNA polymerase subunit omega [Candidatus Aerophobetes bacterium]
MINFSIDELLKKAKIDNKYELTRLAIKRARELIKEKDKNVLDNSNEKLITSVLREIIEGKMRLTDKD